MSRHAVRVRQRAWGAAGAAGQTAPGSLALRAHYRVVVGLLARRLIALPGVEAVLAYGSYATRLEFAPGRSDVDLAVAIADLSPEEEVALLARIGQVSAPHRAVLPIDLTPIPRCEWPQTALQHALRRTGVADTAPRCPVPAWQVLGGADPRGGDVAALDARLWAISDGVLAAALDAGGAPRATARALWQLDLDVRREQVPWPAALDLATHVGALRRGRRLAVLPALGAALAVLDEQRAQRAFPLARPAGSLVPSDAAVPDAAAVAAAAAWLERLDADARGALRSATLHAPPFEPGPQLVLEAADVPAARPLLAAALGARPPSMRVQVLTTRLAEDSWRSHGLRWISLAAGAHLAGEPLAPRLRLPAAEVHAALLRFQATFDVAGVRACLAARPGPPRAGLVPLLAAHCMLAAGTPPELAMPDPAASSPSTAAWVADGLRLWRAAP